MGSPTDMMCVLSLYSSEILSLTFRLLNTYIRLMKLLNKQNNEQNKSGYCRNEKLIILEIKVLSSSYVVEIIEDRVWRSLCA